MIDELLSDQFPGKNLFDFARNTHTKMGSDTKSMITPVGNSGVTCIGKLTLSSSPFPLIFSILRVYEPCSSKTYFCSETVWVDLCVSSRCSDPLYSIMS